MIVELTVFATFSIKQRESFTIILSYVHNYLRFATKNVESIFFFLFRIECKTKHRNDLFDLDFTKLFSNFRMNSLKWNHEFRIDVFNFHLLLLFRLFSNGKYSYISSANMISLHYFRLYIELLIYSGRIRIVNMTYLLRVYWARK